VGANDVVLPVGTTSLKATLVSQRSADEVYVARSTSTLAITPETEEIIVQFGAYQKQAMRNVMGILYEANGNPADAFQLSLVDGHSGAEIGLADEGGDVRPDARGVYALRTYLGESTVRLRVRGKTLVRDLVLPIGASVGNDTAGLPFVNLTGSDLRSPFLLNASLLKGDKGDKGDKGASGVGAGLLVQAEPAGANCSAGGSKISSWTQAAGTTSQTYNPASGSSDLVVSYVCAPPAGNNTMPLYWNGTNVGNFVSYGALTYLSTDGVLVPIYSDSEPGRFTTTQPFTAGSGDLDKLKPAVLFASNDCTGTPYLLKNQNLAFTTPLGSSIRALDLTPAASRTAVVLQSAFQSGGCKTNGIRYLSSPIVVGSMIGVLTDGYDSTLSVFGSNATLPNTLRAGTSVPFATNSSLQMAPLANGEFIARGNHWGSGSSMNYSFFRSSNNRQTWAPFTPSIEGSLSEYSSTYFLGSAPSGVLVLVTYSGIYTSENGGAGWKQRNTGSDTYSHIASIDVATNTLYVQNTSQNIYEAVSLATGVTSAPVSTGVTSPMTVYGFVAHNGILAWLSYNGTNYQMTRHVLGGTSTFPNTPFPSFELGSCGGKVFAAEYASPGGVKVSNDMGATWSTLTGVVSDDSMSTHLRVACSGNAYTLHYGKRLYSGDGANTWTQVSHNFNASRVLSTREVQLPPGMAFPLGNLSTTP
jgi:hypothetical protein